MGIEAALIGGGLGLAGSLLGGKSQKDAAKASANATTAASQQAADTQLQMYNQSRADTAPQRQLFDESLPYLRNLAFGQQPQQRTQAQMMPVSGQGGLRNIGGMLGTIGDIGNMTRTAASGRGGPAIPMTLGPEGQYISRLDQMSSSAGMPQIPGLESDVPLNLDEDQIYQLQRDEMMKQLNRRYAAGGQYASSDADNAVTRNLLPYMQDAYSRNLDTVNRRNQNALTSYGLGYQRQGDIYGRDRSQLMDLYNLQSNMGDRQYGRVLDMAKIGAGAAQTAGQNAMATGQGLASTYMNQGNTLANIAQQRGQDQANMWGGIGGAAMGAGNNYMLYNLMQQNQGINRSKPIY